MLDYLYTARPTAVNLGAATRRLSRVLEGGVLAGKDARAIAQELIEEGRRVADEDVGRSKEMAKHGAEWLVEHTKAAGGDASALNVLTVCNTGSLATSVRYQFLPFLLANCSIACSDFLDVRARPNTGRATARRSG